MNYRPHFPTVNATEIMLTVGDYFACLQPLTDIAVSERPAMISWMTAHAELDVLAFTLTLGGPQRVIQICDPHKIRKRIEAEIGPVPYLSSLGSKKPPGVEFLVQTARAPLPSEVTNLLGYVLTNTGFQDMPGVNMLGKVA